MDLLTLMFVAEHYPRAAVDWCTDNGTIAEGNCAECALNWYTDCECALFTQRHRDRWLERAMLLTESGAKLCEACGCERTIYEPA